MPSYNIQVGGEYDDLPRVGDAPVALHKLARLDVRREELLVLARDLGHRCVELGRADVDLPALVDVLLAQEVVDGEAPRGGLELVGRGRARVRQAHADGLELRR